MANFTLDELKTASDLSQKSSYTNDEIAWYYNLYNRVFQQNKQPGCGKCFANIRSALARRYEALSNG